MTNLKSLRKRQYRFEDIDQWGFPGDSVVKNHTTNAREAGDVGSIPLSPALLEKITWSRKWQHTSLFLPGKFHEQRNLADTVHRVAKSWTQLND